MRLKGTQSIDPTRQHLYRDKGSNRSRSQQYRESRPSQSTTAGPSYIYTPMISQAPIQASARPRDHGPASSQLFSEQRHTTPHHAHQGAPGIQTIRPTFSPASYSQQFHAAPIATTRRRSLQPPPLNFNQAPHHSIPLPDMIQRPVTLNPILAYSDRRTAHNELNVSQRQAIDDQYGGHICAPATNPSVGFITIMLPNGRGITVHASLRHRSFVTVGDVLDELDVMLFGKPPREEAAYGGWAGPCSCIRRTNAIHSLRKQYEWAGLVRAEEGFDVWDLRIG
jgi:hypothetical protein